MKVSELKAKQGKVDITLQIMKKDEPREFSKFGMVGKVCNCLAKDDSGEIKITLWNEQVEQVQEGNTIQISNGYVSEYQGELQLSTGKFGKLDIVQ